MNSIEYLRRFFGLRKVTRHVPSGFNSVLFHICKTRILGLMSFTLTYLIGNTFTVAPQVKSKSSQFLFKLTQNNYD